MERVDVAVVGGGQAGLATSHELAARGVDHVVLERGRVGQTWRDRWDSFCLVTPNWSLRLPGGAYAGDDPDGYLPRDEIVHYLEGYAAAHAGDVRQGVEVAAIRDTSDGFELDTSSGPLAARALVIANGAYQRSHRPPGVDGLPGELAVLELGDYTNEATLPPGRVLVIGSGQSGCQLAEELHEAGREVFLACGRAPWVPRRVGGRDIFWWILEIGFMAMPLSSLPDPAAGRLESNPLATGHGGGHDLHLRTLRAMGVTLLGHFEGADGGVARFAQDLGDIVAWGDQRHVLLMGLIEKTAAARGIAVDIEPPTPFDPASPATLDLAGFGAVVLTGGFRPDYRSWLPWPDAFDDLGFPIQHDGASTVVPGLSFVGVHFLRTRKSSLLMGVGEDAAVVAEGVASRAYPR
ncbi:MAG: NAD(P)-binding domain-containing protein [Actinomycetota bacterium]